MTTMQKNSRQNQSMNDLGDFFGIFLEGWISLKSKTNVSKSLMSNCPESNYIDCLIIKCLKAKCLNIKNIYYTIENNSVK